MYPLTSTDLLNRWEQGLNQTLPRRAFTLLAAALSDLSEEELLNMSIGQRERELLRLRERLFGPRFTFVASCPACSTQIESTFHSADIDTSAPVSFSEKMALEFEGYRVNFRLATVGDTLILGDGSAGEDPVRTLLGLCLLQAVDPSDAPLTANSLPETVVEAIAERMAIAEPQTDVQLALSCPECAQTWQAVFDIASFLWREIHAWAQRTLRDVDQLAKAYGWHESHVLALTPTRRQIYVELSQR